MIGFASTLAVLLATSSAARLGAADPGAAPRAAARAFVEAVLRGDAAAALALVAEPSEMDRAVVRAQAAGADALGRLEEVATSHFGARGDLGVASKHRRLLAALETAPLEVHGDRAALRPPGEKPFRMRRVSGSWKVESPAERLTGKSQKQIEQALERTESAAKDVGEKIRSKAVKTAEEAREALRKALGKDQQEGVPL
jgi:hypothetical protein